jgi:Zn-dependent alcohol dehydrogenase
MKTRAAVLWGIGEPWKVTDIELDPPKAGEVLVKMHAAGLCHSDEHAATGDLSFSNEVAAEMGMPPMFPLIGGHEGAGVVVEVGPGVKSVKAGDHVSASFIPSCGRCRYCSTGRQNLCDLGAKAFERGQITDGTARHHVNGEDLNLFAKLGTFSEHTVVAEASVIKVEPDLPLNVVALVSCGVATGATRVIAVDPVEFKREKAMEFGATHTYSSMEEAFPSVTELTWGQMADKVIMTPGVMYGNLMQMATALCGKGGTVVVTAIAPMTQTESSVNLFELAMWNKEIKGTIFGSCNPRYDIPNLLSMYREGTLKLDELITRTYGLDEINEGYRAMRDGENIRGVIVFD